MEEMMQHRVTVLSSAFVMACLLALGLAPATAAQQDVGISYDGQEIYQYGSADCDSEQGGNSAIAVGDGSFADTEGVNNTAIAIGFDAFAEGGDDFQGETAENNLALAVGDDAFADAADGTNNTAISVGTDTLVDASDNDEDQNNLAIGVGDFHGANTEGVNNTAIAVGVDSQADVDDEQVENSTGIAIGDNSDVDVDDDNCFVIEVGGTEFEFGDCD